MSHEYLKTQWSDFVNNLDELYNEEMDYQSLGLADKAADCPSAEKLFTHYSKLLVRYISNYKRVEECYDLMVHPQKRQALRFSLETLMSRLVEVYKLVTKTYSEFLTLHPENELKNAGKAVSCDFLIMNQIMSELKKTPQDLEIYPPRYFREMEKAEERDNLLNACYLYAFNSTECDRDDEKIIYIPPMMRDTDPEADAVENRNYKRKICILSIQTNERGRQGRARFKHNYEQVKKTKKQEVMLEQHEAEDHLVNVIKKGFRAMLAREKVKEMREEEFEFLGMKRVTSAEDLFEEQLRRDNRSQKKLIQKEYEKEMHKSKMQLNMQLRKSDSKRIEMEEYDRVWDEICNFKEVKGGNWIKGAELEDKVLNPEPEGEDDGKDKGKKKKDEPKKKPAKKKGKKGKKEAFSAIGVSKSTDDFRKCIEDFKEWEYNENSGVNELNNNELANAEQRVDTNILKKNLLVEIEEDVKKKVHKQIMEELDALQDAGKKKKGKKKKGKKGKKGADDKEDEEEILEAEAKKRDKKVKPKQTYGTRRDNFAEMVKKRFVRKIEPTELNDLVGGFDYIASEKILASLDPEGGGLYEPSMHQLKNFVTTQLIIPLACKAVRQRLAAVGKKEVVKHCLFFGPQGTGKYTMAKAIAYHSGAFFLDLSPYNMKEEDAEGSFVKYVQQMALQTFKVARDYGPAVVFMDNIDLVFGEKKFKPFKTKVLKKQMTKFVTDANQILVLGTISQPNPKPPKSMKKDLKLFSSTLFFPLPQFAELKSVWRKFIETKVDAHNVQIDVLNRVHVEEERMHMMMAAQESREKAPLESLDFDDLAPITNKFKSIELNYGDFRLDSLADVSYGYTGGCIRACVNQVLTAKRMELWQKMPLSVSDFVEKLSFTNYIEASDYEMIRSTLEGKKKAKKGGKKGKKGKKGK